MTGRQKKGIGFGITGGGFLAAAIVLLFTKADVGILTPILTLIGTIGAALGFKIVLPNSE